MGTDGMDTFWFKLMAEKMANYSNDEIFGAMHLITLKLSEQDQITTEEFQEIILKVGKKNAERKRIERENARKEQQKREIRSRKRNTNVENAALSDR